MLDQKIKPAQHGALDTTKRGCQAARVSSSHSETACGQSTEGTLLRKQRNALATVKLLIKATLSMIDFVKHIISMSYIFSYEFIHK